MRWTILYSLFCVGFLLQACSTADETPDVVEMRFLAGAVSESDRFVFPVEISNFSDRDICLLEPDIVALSVRLFDGESQVEILNVLENAHFDGRIDVFSIDPESSVSVELHVEKQFFWTGDSETVFAEASTFWVFCTDGILDEGLALDNTGLPLNILEAGRSEDISI